jgi:hypothetical protein
MGVASCRSIFLLSDVVFNRVFNSSRFGFRFAIGFRSVVVRAMGFRPATRPNPARPSPACPWPRAPGAPASPCSPGEPPRVAHARPHGSRLLPRGRTSPQCPAPRRLAPPPPSAARPRGRAPRRLALPGGRALPRGRALPCACPRRTQCVPERATITSATLKFWSN